MNADGYGRKLLWVRLKYFWKGFKGKTAKPARRVEVPAEVRAGFRLIVVRDITAGAKLPQ
jgi:hypothetical protein